MRTILFLIFAFFGSVASLEAMQSPKFSQDLKFTQQLAEAISSDNIIILRSLLIDALDKKDSDRTETILFFIKYEDAYSLIISWVPDTDEPMTDKIQACLDFLQTFSPSIDDDNEDLGELSSPVFYEPKESNIFAPFTQSEQQDGL
ncbi:MAG: hypothetical protein WC365_00285 [Candidatus Babeliales bacterium]|jgi:hypothetical protein